jgi:hypothetical protein
MADSSDRLFLPITIPLFGEYTANERRDAHTPCERESIAGNSGYERYQRNISHLIRNGNEIVKVENFTGDITWAGLNRKEHGDVRKTEGYVFEEGAMPVTVHTVTPGIYSCQGIVLY